MYQNDEEQLCNSRHQHTNIEDVLARDIALPAPELALSNERPSHSGQAAGRHGDGALDGQLQDRLPLPTRTAAAGAGPTVGDAEAEVGDRDDDVAPGALEVGGNCGPFLVTGDRVAT